MKLSHPLINYPPMEFLRKFIPNLFYCFSNIYQLQVYISSRACRLFLKKLPQSQDMTEAICNHTIQF